MEPRALTLEWSGTRACRDFPPGVFNGCIVLPRIASCWCRWAGFDGPFWMEMWATLHKLGRATTVVACSSSSYCSAGFFSPHERGSWNVSVRISWQSCSIFETKMQKKKQSCLLTHAKLLLKSWFSRFTVVNRYHLLYDAGLVATVAGCIGGRSTKGQKKENARHQDGRRAPPPSPTEPKAAGWIQALKG